MKDIFANNNINYNETNNFIKLITVKNVFKRKYI